MPTCYSLEVAEEPAQRDEFKCFCLDCRYPLRGLTNHVCPECGRGFDLKDPTTFSPTASRWSWAVPYDAICAHVFSLPLLLLLLDVQQRPVRRGYFHSSWYLDQLAALETVLFGIGLIVFLAVHIHPQRRTPGTVLLPIVLTAALTIAWFSRSTAVIFVLCASIACTLLMARKAFVASAWWSRRLAGLAAIICLSGTFVLLQHLSLEHADIINYWTYWFWTPQRF